MKQFKRIIVLLLVGIAITAQSQNPTDTISSINGDGQISTNIDINGDGVINIYDSEYGALKIANSWGTSWFGNNGFIWLPYSLLDEIMPINYDRRVYVCEVEECDVQLAYKATIGHLNRGHLSLQVGYGLATNEKDSYNVFNYQSLDFSHCTIMDTMSSYNDSVFATIDLGDLYLRMEESGEKGAVGKLPRFVPVSREAHEKQTMYALSQLPKRETIHASDYPSDYWMDVVTEQPEGYVMDEQGNVTISSAEGLAWFAAVVNGRNGQEANDFEGKEVKLVSDIDMGLHLWEAIGNSYFDDSICFDYIQRFFKGTFDGGKFEISNLIHGYRGYYRMPDPYGYEKYQGLFGNLINASVSNLRINVFVCLNDLEDGLHFGSVAAVAEESVIDRCYSKGYLFPEDHFFGDKGIPAGGIAYRSLNSRISNCVFVADSCISIQMGGVVHDNYTSNENHRAEVSNCYVFGRIIDYVIDPLRIGYSAGIVHTNKADSGIEKGSIVRNCYYYPVSPGNDMVGRRKAIACSNYTGCIIENCYYLAVPNLNFYSGVCGENGGSVNNVSAFNCVDYSCVLEDPVEIGGEMVDDLKEALNRWVTMQQNSADYENWCDDVWMEQGGAPLLCAVYEATEENGEDLNHVSFYPNPTTGQFTVEGANVAKVEVYDLVGQKVCEQQGSKVVNINAAEWNKGIYLVNIIEENGVVVTKKLVVK